MTTLDWIIVVGAIVVVVVVACSAMLIDIRRMIRKRKIIEKMGIEHDKLKKELADEAKEFEAKMEELRQELKEHMDEIKKGGH